MEQSTISQNDKYIAAIGYFGILCLIPLLTRKDSAFAQHHGKQSLVVLIVWILLWVGQIVPVLGTIVWLLGSVWLLILLILGFVNALNGKMWEMPVLAEWAKRIRI